MAQNIFEKIKNSDLSAMSVADFDRLFAEIAKAGGKPRNMKKADYDAFIADMFAAREAAVMRENSQQQALAATDNKTDEPKATDEEKEKFAANIEAMNGMKYDPDADHRKMVNHLLIDTEDGKGARLQEELIEAANLKVLVDNAENDQPLDKEAYKTAVDKEIETIIGTMFKASANSNEDVKANSEKWRDLIDKQETISHKVASGVLSDYLMDAKAKANKLADKYENKNFLAGFTSRLNNVVKSAEKKLGKFFKQTWKTCKVMYKQGTWKESLLGGGLAFGSLLAAGTVVGAPISAGLAVYSAWVARKRVKPVIDAYHKEKEINGKDYKFSDFYASHKRDVWKAGLYTVAGAAGAVAGVVGAVAPFVNTATDTAVILNGVRGAATTTRLAAIPAATTTPYVIDYFNAETKEDRKQALKNIAITGGLSAVGMAGAVFGADLIGDANASEVAPVDGASADAPHAPVHTEWGNGDNNDWRHPWGQGTGVGDAPADASADGSVDGTADGSSAEASDAYVHQFETRIPTPEEQAFYEKRLNLILDQETRDAMIANAQSDEIVHLTKNMSPEQAIHLAVMDKLYYGDDTALKLLLECDSVKNINSEEFFNNLHGKFVTDMNDKLPMGFPTDPNYVADPNIYTKGVDPHCDDNKLIGRMLRKTIVNIRETEVINHTPTVETTIPNEPVEIKGGHGDSALKIREQIGGNEPVELPEDRPDFTLPGGHASSKLQALGQLGGNNPVKVEVPDGFPLTDEEFSNVLAGKGAEVSTNITTSAPVDTQPQMTPDQLAKANATLGKQPVDPSSSELQHKTFVKVTDAIFQASISNGGRNS